jgi:predicted metal-dependent hydrolase
MDAVEVRRSRRARHWRLVVPWGEPARLTVPQRMSNGEITRVLAQQQDWIRQQRRRQIPRLGLGRLVVSEAEARAGARELVSALADDEAAALAVSYGRIRIGAQRTLWGSCSPAARFPSTGGLCSHPSTYSITSWCTRSVTCGCRIILPGFGVWWSGGGHSGGNSGTG